MKKTTKFIVPMFMIVSLFLLTSCQTYVTTSNEEMNTMSVQGMASVAASPDEAKIYFRIETNTDTAEDAEREGALKADKLVNALKQQGVKDHEIETTQFNLQPRWDWTEQGRVFKGYQLYHVMRVTTTDTENTGKLIDAAVAGGANGVDTVEFALSKEKRKQVFSEALEKAIEEARAKANAMGKTLNVGVGKPIKVSEQNFNYQPYQFAGDMAMAESASMRVAPPTPISPSEVEVSATVQVSFMIN